MGFIDNFNDNSISALWTKATLETQNAAVTVLEQNQRIEVTPLASTAGLNYNALRTVATYDLSGAQVVVNVAQVAGGGSANTQLYLEIDANNYYGFVHEAGTLYFKKRVASVNSSTNVAYNATTHAWWRIRHRTSDDHILWDTSTDGVTWTNRRDIARDLTVTSMKVELCAGTYESVGSPGVAHFDNFKLLQTSFNDTMLADGVGLVYLLDEASGNLVNTGPTTGYAFDEVSSNWTRQVAGQSGPEQLAVQTTSATQSNSTHGHAQVTVPPASFDGATAASLEIVFKVTPRASGCIFVLGAFTETTLSLEFNVGNTKLMAGITTATTSFATYELTSALGAFGSTWQHVVLTWDGTNLKGYLNGNLVLTQACGTGATGMDMSYPNPRFALCGAPDDQNVNLAGYVDVIGLYETVALDSTQVTAHYTQLGIAANLAFRRSLMRSQGARSLMRL